MKSLYLTTIAMFATYASSWNFACTYFVVAQGNCVCLDQFICLLHDSV
jgi:hypothetical protein